VALGWTGGWEFTVRVEEVRGLVGRLRSLMKEPQVRVKGRRSEPGLWGQR
jgi:hypothetical protein